MPVPTPRTTQPSINVDQETPPPSFEEIDNIPEDWKDEGEIFIKPKECHKITNLEESVKPWTQPAVIIEEPEPEEEDPDNVEVNVKDMKKFWEVATSPINSPTTSPPTMQKMVRNIPISFLFRHTGTSKYNFV